MKLNINKKKGNLGAAKGKLPRLALFGDPEKLNVSEAIEEFADFAKSEVKIVASCHIQDCTDEILEECDFAVVFGEGARAGEKSCSLLPSCGRCEAVCLKTM